MEEIIQSMTDVVDNETEDSIAGVVQYLLGRDFLENEDFENALKSFRKSAILNNRDAMFALGFMYYRGEGVERDEESAFSWYLKSARLGHVTGMNEVGVMLEHGIGTEVNFVEALKWFFKSSLLGDFDGMCNLGVMYLFGVGVEVDERKGAYWFNRASKEGGHLSATNSLGFLYETGRGVKQNKAEAFRLYLSCARNGEEFGQVNVGRCYEEGIGVERDPERAREWYETLLEDGGSCPLTQIGYYYFRGTELIGEDWDRALLFLKVSLQKGGREGKNTISWIQDVRKIEVNFGKRLIEQDLADVQFYFQA